MLDSIFISHHFDDKAIELAEHVQRLVISHKINAVTGKRLAGQQLSPAVRQKIDKCQASIVLLTDRDEGKTNQWVRDERAYALGKQHQIITLLDNGLKDEAMFSDFEKITIDYDNFHLNLLYLSETISIWKDMAGQKMKLLLRPKEISKQIANNIGQFPIQYRIWSEEHYEANAGPQWRNVVPRPEEGGATLYLKGIQPGDMIEVEANINGAKWGSAAANHNVIVELKKR